MSESAASVCGVRSTVLYRVTATSPEGGTTMRIDFRSFTEAVLCVRRWGERGWLMRGPTVVSSTDRLAPALQTRKEPA